MSPTGRRMWPSCWHAIACRPANWRRRLPGPFRCFWPARWSSSSSVRPSMGRKATPPNWPCIICSLVTGRLRGVAIREAGLDHAGSVSVAAQLGQAVGRLHQLPAPGPVAGREVLREMRAGAAERLRRFGLPGHLAEQVPGYLADALPATSLVHGDITADHVFVDRAELVGLIDWGDALIADPYYELVAVYFDAFGGQRPLLTEFLRGYGWDRADDFGRRALQGVLEFQFDALSRISEMADLTEVKDLGQLAERLFG